jgi:hypothetical protein
MGMTTVDPVRFTYDVPTVSRPALFSGLREESASHLGDGRGTPTTPLTPVVATNTVDDVIAETASATKKNITSAHTLTPAEALEAGQRWVGEGYSEIGKPGSGVFRSADGTKQFRMDEGSLLGNHAPNVPHVHLETYLPGARLPSVNNHIPCR